MKIRIPRRWAIFFITCLLFVLSQFYRASVAVISPNLVADLGLDTRGLSLVSAAFFYAFAVMQIPIGLYLDSLGPRITMTVLTLVAVAGALLFGLGSSLAVLVAGRALPGGRCPARAPDRGARPCHPEVLLDRHAEDMRGKGEPRSLDDKAVHVEAGKAGRLDHAAGFAV